MNYKLIYYITHYLWLFQLLFNLILIIKTILFIKKYKKNSLTMCGFLMFLFPILIELIFGFIFIMFDYVHNTRIDGPFYWFPEIMITFSLVISNVLLWFSSNWRLTYENDKFVYHNLFFKKKNIIFDEIDCSKSYIVKPKNRKFLKYEHYQYIVFHMKNNVKIKVIFDIVLCDNSSSFLILDLEEFLVKKLKFKVKLLSYEEYKEEKKLFSFHQNN